MILIPQEPVAMEDAIVGVSEDIEIEPVQKQSSADAENTELPPIVASTLLAVKCSQREEEAPSENNDDAVPLNKNETSEINVDDEQADRDVWKKKYCAKLLDDYNEQHEELEDLKEEQEDLKYFMNKEKSKGREIIMANCALQEDLSVICHDRDKLFEECVNMKTLLASRDQNIKSLVAQVNLLIQVGTIKRTNQQELRESPTDARWRDSSRGMFKSFSSLFTPSLRDGNAGPTRQGAVKRASEGSIRHVIFLDQMDSS